MNYSDALWGQLMANSDSMALLRYRHIGGRVMLLMNTALLIIDMQSASNDPQLGRRNNPDAELRTLDLLQAWRKAQKPVIHICHVSKSPGAVVLPRQPRSEFQVALTPLAQEHWLEKSVPDAFSSGALKRWLRMKRIQSLVICGVVTNNSVEATARSAACLGFDVSVVSDAVFTFDLVDLSGRLWRAEDIHAISLSNLAMNYAKIVTAKEVLQLI